jgi:hypothetical protein
MLESYRECPPDCKHCSRAGWVVVLFLVLVPVLVGLCGGCAVSHGGAIELDSWAQTL